MESLPESKEKIRTGELTPPPIPNITLPLPLFLDILWGYKKGVELRERAVPGPEVITALEAIPNHAEYVHIQKQGGEIMDTVWQRLLWRTSGEREEERNAALKQLWAGIDYVLDRLRPNFPMFTREQLRGVASDLITNEKWETLEGMGIDCSKYKK